MERTIHVLKFVVFYIYILLDSPSGPTPPHCSGFEITLRQDTLHSVGLLRTSDQPDAETSI